MTRKETINRLKLIWSHKGLLIGTGLLLGLLRFGLLILPYRWVTSCLDRTSIVKKGVGTGDMSSLTHLTWATQAMGRRMLGDKPCLPQALALQWLLRRRCIRTELHIGVRRQGEHKLDAHAWLEKEGQVIIGGRQSPVRFKRMQTSQS